ncbi:MAG: DUF262 domain-containing protein [Nostocales cyanobacterium ELA583]|jgi:hypothetical protein
MDTDIILESDIPDESIDEENNLIDEEINEPFDPTKIRVETRQVSIDELLARISYHQLELEPEFQRKKVWNQIAKSRLIESILLRIPLPAFYIDATNEEKWLVIDGLQRLNSLKEFIIDKQLRLTGLESFTQFNDKVYDEIPRNYQRRIEETNFTIIFLEPGTDQEYRQAIFERINTSGSALSSQEIRHALNQGKATKLLENLANSSEFKTATNSGIKADRMMDRECILRVLVFMLDNQELFDYQSYKKVLEKAMIYINNMSDEEIKLLETKFKDIMNLAVEIFGENAFRKNKGNRYPVNKALFEAWSVKLYQLNCQKINFIKERKENLQQKIIDWSNNGKFTTSLYGTLGTFKTVNKRLEQIQELITQVLS